MLHVLGIGLPYGGDWIVIGIVAVLLFGKRLPEVGKSLGRGIIEFKKGLRGIEDDVDAGVNGPPSTPATAPPTTPAPSRPALPSEFKFDPVTGQPLSRPEPQETVAREPQKPAYRFDPYTGEPIGARKED
jgi:sec-independent protein translocase protein TatA